MKTCKECGRLLKYNKFYTSVNVKDGYENRCKECRNKARLRHRNVCETCGEVFHSQKEIAYYCSQKCKPQSQRDRVKVECYICGGEKEVTPSRYSKAKHFYCSSECQSKGYSLNYTGENSPKYNHVEVKCTECGQTIERVKSETIYYSEFYCSEECRISRYKERFKGENNPMFGVERPEMRGANNPSWNPKRTHKQRKKERKLAENSQWRRDVFLRDNYTCKVCNKRGSGNIVAHHLNGYNWDIQNRTNVDNGVTLCEDCHMDFHRIYGYGDNTSFQFKEFINKKAIPSQAD